MMSEIDWPKRLAELCHWLSDHPDYIPGAWDQAVPGISKARNENPHQREWRDELRDLVSDLFL